ncbi:tol-pal system protein YbgF [Acidobacteriota bacterium]
MLTLCRYICPLIILVLSGGCGFMSINKDVARLERKIEDLQDQVYALKKANEEMSETVEQLDSRKSRYGRSSFHSEESTKSVNLARVEDSDGTVTIRSANDIAPQAPQPAWKQETAFEEAEVNYDVTEEEIPRTENIEVDQYENKPSQPAEPAADKPDPSYTKGLKALNTEEYNAAIMSFEGFIEASPDSMLADNAQFYIAEAYYRGENYPQAIVEFNRVIDLYPDGDAVAESLFKIGLSYEELNDRRNAMQYLRRVVKHYPDSSAAYSARRTIKKLERG